jgi:predicted nuclease with RNAse H fold
MVPGVERQPLKKLKPNETQLLKLMDRWRHEAVQAGREIERVVVAYEAGLDRWRHEAVQAGREIERVVVAYEAGRDGFWLARWLRERGVEAYVIHPSSIAVSREHRRAKTDRLDTELLMRSFLGWLRSEKRRMASIPTIEEEDAKRPNREREKLVGDRTRIVNRMKSTLSRFGIRGFKPTLRKADEKLGELRTAEGELLPFSFSALSILNRSSKIEAGSSFGSCATSFSENAFLRMLWRRASAFSISSGPSGCHRTRLLESCEVVTLWRAPARCPRRLCPSSRFGPAVF